MSDEAKKTNDKAEVTANPASDASELSDESLKNVTGGESVTLTFSKIQYTYVTQSDTGASESKESK